VTPGPKPAVHAGAAALGNMAGILSGAPPAARLKCEPGDPAQALREAAAVLETADSAGARHVGRVFSRFLSKGGDLPRMLGVRARQGGAYDLPHRRGPLSARDARLVALAGGLSGSRKARARCIAEMSATGHPAITIIHEQTGATVPCTVGGIVRILRQRDH
jgi:hypothetical protein